MKMQAQRERPIMEVSFLRACDINLAWSPTNESPISPWISALGTSAATESITTTSTAFDLTKVSAMESASSPQSGWEIRRLSKSTPILLA